MKAIKRKIVDGCINCERGCRGQSCPYFPHEEVQAIVLCNCCGNELDDEDDVTTIEEDYICRKCIKEYAETFFEFRKVRSVKNDQF